LGGSESEKKFGFGYRPGIGSRHLTDENFCEKSKIKHLKEKNLTVNAPKFELDT
jgi:hypothetical protein